MKIYRINPHDSKPGFTHMCTMKYDELLEAEARRLRDIEWLRAMTKPLARGGRTT